VGHGNLAPPVNPPDDNMSRLGEEFV